MVDLTNRPEREIRRLFVELIVEERAQDLVEYALLAAFIGVAGWAVVMALPNVMGATYASWIDTNVGVPSRWDPPEPTSGGS